MHFQDQWNIFHDDFSIDENFIHSNYMKIFVKQSRFAYECSNKIINLKKYKKNCEF